MQKVVAIIPAAGSGKRMGENTNKQFLEIGGKAVLGRTLQAFEEANLVDSIIIVAKSDEIERVRELVTALNYKKIRCVVPGGRERQDSIVEGIKQFEEDDKWVLVHDGARPFISPKEVDRFILHLKEVNAPEEDNGYTSLITAVPTKDTIKRVSSGRVKETLDRANLYNVQTPQGFIRDVLVRAYENAAVSGYVGTDDASLVEYYGGAVEIHTGWYENIKITTPEDLFIGEAILKMRGDSTCALE